MKTTQFLTNIKLWQNALLAFIFLFSLSTFSQIDAASAVVGDELTYNGMLSTDGDEGVTGSGTGCAPCGWNAMQGTNYAPTNNGNNNGACHSENRQFKMFATNGNNGSFVNQEITNLPAGTFTYDYWTKWAGVPTYTDENGDTLEPKFTIRVLQADGSYAVAKEELIPLSDDQVWSQTTGTWENSEAGATVRLQWYKRGGTNAAPTGLNKSMFVDSVSFTYTAEASSGVSTFPYCTTFDTDLGDWTAELISGSGSYVPWYVSATNYNSSVAPQNGAGMAFMYDNSAVANLTSTAMDISGLTDPQLTFSYTQPTWSGDQDELRVWYKAAAGDDWAELAAYTSSVTAWETVTLALPNASSDYYIAFNGTAGYGYGITLDDVCVDAAPTEPLMSVTATTDGGSATFSFDIQNFTVGSDDSADGHIHYSLNGGTEVMVYSSDDLTLTDLPNGDHTIVFSLVDANHTALDPAVTATVEFSTFDGTVACDDSFTYTYDNNESGTLFSASNAGGEVTVTVTGTTETNYDFLIVRDGAGNELYNASGDHTGQAITSTDGTLTVEITSDGSVNGSSFGAITFDVTCAASQANVTFSVNMSNYPGGLGADDTVHLNGSFAGWCGDCIPMSDDDGDGIWTVTIPLDDGNYEYKFTVNGWSNQESWPGDGTTSCAENADDGTYENRAFTVAGEDMTLETVYWNLCIGEEPGATYTVTFEVNTSAIVGGVGANGIYAGGGILGNAQALQLSDDDGDGVWVGSIDLPEGTTGNYIFLNSPGDGGDWGTKENLEGQDCADPNNYNDRILPEVTADVTYLACFGNCSGDGTGECPSTGTTWQLTMTVNTANITVGENGMFLGGGYFGGANAYPMSDDDGDGTWEVTVEVVDGASGNYAFFNSPNASDDWGTKENIEGQACADPANYNDRILEAVTADTTLMHCFGSCETDGSCSAGPCPSPDITSWSMTGDGAIFDGNNQDGVVGYEIEYSTSTFTPGDGTATVYEFDSFPHTMTGLEPNTTYYFTIRSVCGEDNYSDWTDNGNDGPDPWTTTICPSSYSLPYLNDFNDPDTWTNCQTFYDNDSDGQFWFYANYTDIDGDGNNVAASASWTSATGALNPDNWVIMGPIDLTNHTDALLEWKVRGVDPAWCQENYSVYVGSSNNYNDLINGSVSYNETIANGGDACGNTFADRSLDISAATGGLVYIGFRHHDVTDVFVLNVDDVSVTSTTMSNEDFTLQNIDYTFNQETNTLRVSSEELLSNIQIYNMLGQEVLNQDLNGTSAVLNLSGLSSSIYIVNVEGNNSKTKTFKLVIK